MTLPAIRTLSTRTAFSGRIFSVEVDRVQLPHGREVSMEVVRHPGSVVLLPMPDPSRLIVVRQYRHAVGRWILELPAGGVEPGESPEAAATRECEEEIARHPGRLERVGALYPTPGFCDELMIFFRLTDLSVPETPAALDRDEMLEPVTPTLDDIRRRIASGEIVDMKTIAGLMLLDATAPVA